VTYAVPTSANFVLNHNAVGAIPGFWSAAVYTQRLVLYSKQVNAFLRITADLTDAESLQTIEVVMDDLLMQAFEYDKETQIVGWNAVTRQAPSLYGGRNAPLRDMLNAVRSGSDADDSPAMTREMHRGTNNSGMTLD
jgi:hypothetical protein